MFRSLAPTDVDREAHALAVIALDLRETSAAVPNTRVPHPAPPPFFFLLFDGMPPPPRALAHLIDIVINQRTKGRNAACRWQRFAPPPPHTAHTARHNNPHPVFELWLVLLSGGVAVSVYLFRGSRFGFCPPANVRTGGWVHRITRDINGYLRSSSFGARRAATPLVGRCVFLSRTPKDGCSHVYAPISVP
ncbi:hypothetical protein BC826DRAFT_234207 [Russula brevipes]|nr:hypothetical protein BC826DRAFT_234207 [Russula brevipes]